ncbi:MAG: hypothetical protein IJO06_07975, partial [Thermoguttaceae bacterium]|nr:hypothetical protein [Thermoguttaceae bacterium]
RLDATGKLDPLVYSARPSNAPRFPPLYRANSGICNSSPSFSADWRPTKPRRSPTRRDRQTRRDRRRFTA